MLHPVYPFGAIAHTEEFKSHEQVKSYTRSYPFVALKKPVRHPMLQEMAGEYDFAPVLPDWWTSAIQETPYPLRYFMIDVSAEEYVKGIVNEERFKLFRQTLKQETRKLIPQSPKIGTLLQGNSYLDTYNERGASHENLKLVISVNPEDVFFMANGNGWTSCQHPSGSGGYASRLRGSLFDVSLAMAYVLTPGKKISDDSSLLARVHLRYGTLHGLNYPTVLIDRTYGNDRTVEKTMVETIREIIEAKGMFCAWTTNTRLLSANDRIGSGFSTYSTVRPNDWEWGYNDSIQPQYESVVAEATNGKTFYSTSLMGQVYVSKGKIIETFQGIAIPTNEKTNVSNGQAVSE